MARCEATIRVTRGSQSAIVQCRYGQGHLADGSHAFAFHSADEGDVATRAVIGRDGRQTLDKKGRPKFKRLGSLGGKAKVAWKDGDASLELVDADGKA